MKMKDFEIVQGFRCRVCENVEILTLPMDLGDLPKELGRIQELHKDCHPAPLMPLPIDPELAAQLPPEDD